MISFHLRKAENLKLRLEFEFARKEQASASAGEKFDGVAQPTMAASPSSIDADTMQNRSLTARARLCDVRDEIREETSTLMCASSESVSRHTQTDLTDISVHAPGLLGGLCPPLRVIVRLVLCVAVAAALYTYVFLPEALLSDSDTVYRIGRTYN